MRSDATLKAAHGAPHQEGSHMRFIDLVPALTLGSKGHGKHGKKKKRNRKTTTTKTRTKTTTRKKKFSYKY
jgi:hypothetical protein